MGGGISNMAKQELVVTIRDQCQYSSKKDKGRILDECTATTGDHRYHRIILLGQPADEEEKQAVGRRTCNEAVSEAVQSVRRNPGAELRRTTDEVQLLRAIWDLGVDSDAKRPQSRLAQGRLWNCLFQQVRLTQSIIEHVKSNARGQLPGVFSDVRRSGPAGEITGRGAVGRRYRRFYAVPAGGGDFFRRPPKEGWRAFAMMSSAHELQKPPASLARPQLLHLPLAMARPSRKSESLTVPARSLSPQGASFSLNSIRGKWSSLFRVKRNYSTELRAPTVFPVGPRRSAVATTCAPLPPGPRCQVFHADEGSGKTSGVLLQPGSLNKHIDTGPCELRLFHRGSHADPACGRCRANRVPVPPAR